MTTDTDRIATLEEVEMLHILDVLARVGWRIGIAAAALGVTDKTVRNRLRDYGLRGLIVPDGNGYRLVERA